MKKILRKTGFTLIELVVVLAIIAILIAMVVPTLSSRDANKHASVLAARDFYSATQHLFTKYSKYEGELYPGQKEDTGKLINYDKSLGGNYPTTLYISLALCVRKGEIVYVDATGADNPTVCEMNLYSHGGVGTETSFEKMLKRDMEPLFTQQDGIYYAYIHFRNNATLVPESTGNTNTVRVLAAAYTPTELPPCGSDYNDFMSKYLLLQDNGLNASGYFLGVCSSFKDNILNNTIGNPGTYFSLYSISAAPSP